jgi:hypothetical protein
MRSWRVDLNANKNTELVLFQDKKNDLRKNAALPSRLHAGISRAAQPSGLDRLKTGGEGRVAEALPVNYFLRDSPARTPRPIEFGDFCRRTQVPGMSKRQRVECSCRFKTPGTPVEKFGSDDVRPDFGYNKRFCQLRDPHTERAITLLPAKVVQLSKNAGTGLFSS